MTDFGLDLAIIGNGRTAALVEPTGRIVCVSTPLASASPLEEIGISPTPGA